MRQHAKSIAVATLLALTSLPSLALAQETTTYTYDALGRVRAVARTGGQNNGVTTNYDYDKAGNRTNARTSGSQNGSGNTGTGATTSTQGFVVTPLGGYALIFYQN